MVAISDVAEVNPGFPRTSKFAPESLVSFLPMAAVSESGEIISQAERPFGEVSKGYTYFAEGDVLMAKITPCMENGKATFVKNLKHPAGFGSTEFHVLRPGSEIDGKYLFYMIWNPLFRKVAGRNMTGTAGQKRVSSSFLKDFKIPLPPLPEQKRIAAILDKADSIRRKRQEAVRLTEELLRSVFLDMFGDPVENVKKWPLLPIGTAIQAIETGWSANSDDRKRDNNEWAVLKISSVTSGCFLPDECKVVADEQFDRVLLTPKRGDLLFSRANTRELVAATCLVEQDEPKLFLPDKLWKIVPNKEITCTEYLRYLLAHPTFREKLTKQATGTSGSMLNISQAKVRGIEIPVPPIKLQKKFADFVWHSYKIRNKLQTCSDSSNTLYYSLIQSFLKGFI